MQERAPPQPYRLGILHPEPRAFIKARGRITLHGRAQMIGRQRQRQRRARRLAPAGKDFAVWRRIHPGRQPGVPLHGARGGKGYKGRKGKRLDYHGIT